jgi:hypothetical protein
VNLLERSAPDGAHYECRAHKMLREVAIMQRIWANIASLKRFIVSIRAIQKKPIWFFTE